MVQCRDSELCNLPLKNFAYYSVELLATHLNLVEAWCQTLLWKVCLDPYS